VLRLAALPQDERYRFETLAGLLLSLFGRIPRVGDTTEWGGWRFEVVDMDGLRIDKVLASIIVPEKAENNATGSGII
jgi:putative hemolysin